MTNVDIYENIALNNVMPSISLYKSTLYMKDLKIRK